MTSPVDPHVAFLRGQFTALVDDATRTVRRRVTDAMLTEWLAALDKIADATAELALIAAVSATSSEDAPPPATPPDICARTACDNPAKHRHRDSGAYYCTACARRINDAHRDDTVVPIS